MKSVVDIKKFRHRQRKAWLAKHRVRLDRFIAHFVDLHFQDDFARITELWQDECRNHADFAWDYHDFREMLVEAITETFGDLLWNELQKQFWFDSRWLSRDEVMERCTTTFVLGQSALYSASR